jgi:hypothetical protein
MLNRKVASLILLMLPVFFYDEYVDIRDEFESNGVDYKQHIAKEHNMWKYVWLKVYLEQRDPLLFTGPENYAFEQMKDKQVPTPSPHSSIIVTFSNVHNVYLDILKAVPGEEESRSRSYPR